MGSVPALLTLEELIGRVLCHDPQLRQAWADAKFQAASVGVKQSAYLPKLSGSFGITRNYNDTLYEQNSDYSVHGRQEQFESRISLSWVLFDFGRREAALRSARYLLVAANSNQDKKLQEVFLLAAQLYYDALSAQRHKATASKITDLAAENLDAASAKYAAGAAALSDRLQAQTAYSQASLNEVRSNGALQNAKGLIALHMGLSPHTSLELAESLTRLPDSQFIQNVELLLEQARRDHPAIISARAKLQAAEATIEEQRALGRPSLSFVANISDVRTNQSIAYNGDRRVRDNDIGLQLSVPLFDGFERTYKIRGARSQFEVNEAEVMILEKNLSLELWSNYQRLCIETRALASTANLAENASQAMHVVRGRYSSGVGNVIELLNALSAYAAAEQQHINTLSSWQMARLKLAASLGRLGFWTI
ncbi:TolC family protein [Pseudomonas prosekii]|uniref:TolC family protein n=1 Tax=Pseudomonas prosekii TaxID=1148509 RepID=UPI00387AD7AF